MTLWGAQRLVFALFLIFVVCSAPVRAILVESPSLVAGIWRKNGNRRGRFERELKMPTNMKIYL